MKRDILLVEPNYKTKFPPLGLMKISAYHKTLGDNVKFVKGVNHGVVYDKYWDRVYVSTMFTYNWKVTVETINYYKYKAVKGDISRIFVGGIMASLMTKRKELICQRSPKTGVLSKPGILDDDNDLIVENMTPDYELFSKPRMLNDDNDLIVENMTPFYELFKDSPVQYSLIDDSYFGYSTRGCPRRCKFCGVRTIEPKFIEYKGIKPYVESIKKKYGEKFHLVLFDNNILASKKFERIIDDIIDLGFQIQSPPEG